ELADHVEPLCLTRAVIKCVQNIHCLLSSRDRTLVFVGLADRQGGEPQESVRGVAKVAVLSEQAKCFVQCLPAAPLVLLRVGEPAKREQRLCTDRWGLLLDVLCGLVGTALPIL